MTGLLFIAFFAAGIFVVLIERKIDCMLTVSFFHSIVAGVRQKCIKRSWRREN